MLGMYTCTLYIYMCLLLYIYIYMIDIVQYSGTCGEIVQGHTCAHVYAVRYAYRDISLSVGWVFLMVREGWGRECL